MDYRLDFVRSYAPCEAYNFEEMDDPVVFIKKTTDWLGADCVINCVGAEASGNLLQTITGKRVLLRARPRPSMGHQIRQKRRHRVGDGRVWPDR